LDYPVTDPQHWRQAIRLLPGERLALAVREMRARWRKGKPTEAPRRSITLRKLGAPLTPLAEHDIPLICIGRNCAETLQHFLHHYRKLGVTRFIMLDDASDDGTAERLAAEADVDLHVSDVGYKQSASGMIWRDMLIDRYGRDRWYVSVDADEFLIYPGSETLGLPAFIEKLEAKGLRRCMAPMLDIYPEGPLRQADYATPGLDSPLDVSPVFDGDGYEARREKFALAVRGGPRQRLFGTDMRTRYWGASIHGPFPFARNYAAPRAILLHAKFSSTSREDFRKIAARGAHYGNSLYYRQIVDADLVGPELDLRYSGSRRFRSTADLVQMGFMTDG
jgi:hypothetical protein